MEKVAAVKELGGPVEGTRSDAEAMTTIRNGADPIAAIAALCLHRFIEIDLDSGRIGPQTRVAPFRG